LFSCRIRSLDSRFLGHQGREVWRYHFRGGKNSSDAFQRLIPITATPRRAGVRMHRRVVRTHRLGSIHAPEDRVGGQARIPANALAAWPPAAFRPEPDTNRRLHIDHVGASDARRIVRRTVTSRIGTLYVFFASGVAPATAARAASRAVVSVSGRPCKTS